MTHPRLTFHGAAGAVTGSCSRFETDQGQILFDCGMFQGSKTEEELNFRPFPFAPDGIAAVILSHAHIDHPGLLPKLVRHGFTGAIHATPATKDLAEGPCGVDYLLCESTYGDADRVDATASARRMLLRDEVCAAMHPKGEVGFDIVAAVDVGSTWARHLPQPKSSSA